MKRPQISDAYRRSFLLSQARGYSTPGLAGHVAAIRLYLAAGGDPVTREADVEWLAMLEAELFTRAAQVDLEFA